MQRKQYLLQKYLARQCNRSELEELFRYLREEPVGNDYDEIIRNIWHELSTDHQLSAEGSEALFQQISVRLPRRSRRSYAGWRVAAGLTGVLLGFWLLYYLLWMNGQVTQAAGYGQTRTVVFPDQSTVVLNGNSTVRYDRRWAENEPRSVWLEGEAYFSVQHLANDQSFTVYTDNLAIEVLGTEFNVQHRRGDTRVTLNSGAIKLNAYGDIPAKVTDVMMQPGEQATLTRNRDFTLATVETEPVIAWKDHELIFDNVPLQEVAQTIEDLYGRPVIIENDSIRQLRLSGTLPNNDMNTLLGLLREIFGIQATEDSQGIRLRK